MKKKVGVYIFTKGSKTRLGSNSSFNRLCYFGFKFVIDEINTEKYDVGYCSGVNVNEFDYVLISIVSYFDILNLISEFRNLKINKNTKIIIGGPGVHNILLYKKYIDVAVFGRAENLINDVLDEKPLENVWYKTKDPELKSQYSFGEVKEFLPMDDGVIEYSVGCQQKCYFWYYTWTNKFCKRKVVDTFRTNMVEREAFFKDMDFNINRAVGGIDGITERTRKLINKPITNQNIIDKFRTIYDDDRLKDRVMFIKLFNIIGYPWEKINVGDLSEIRYVLKQSDYSKNHTMLKLGFSFCHFIPKIMTPLENYGVNFIDFRTYFNDNGFLQSPDKGQALYSGANIKAFVYFQMAKASSVVEEMVIERGNEEDLKYVINIFFNPKYKSLKYTQKVRFIKKHIPERLWGKTDIVPVPYLNRTYKTNKAKARLKSLIGF